LHRTLEQAASLRPAAQGGDNVSGGRHALVTIDAVLADGDVNRRELIAWIEQKWVLPVEQEGSYLFNEADRARVKLIVELRRDLAINDEAMPVVLQLLDQIYALRRSLSDLQHAIGKLPDDARAELDRHLPRDDEA
ncbi:MAG: chaperone modulator CbpM, partial [Kiloniellales bacterium]